jgi:glycerophosphoryl diester phosphodiesterase
MASAGDRVVEVVAAFGSETIEFPGYKKIRITTFDPMHRFLVLFLMAALSSFAQKNNPPFDIQGHRGARGLKPENTIPAFLTGLDSGVTTLEMDVVITKDKKVVVSHDPWISPEICLDPEGNKLKAKDKKLIIYTMTYDQVSRYDCGSAGNEKFPEQQKIHTSKPLLSDVIVAVENHIKSFTQYDVDYNIEIKSDKKEDGKSQPSPEEFSDLVYELVDQYIPLDRVIIQSFDFRVLKYWHKKYPEIRLSALVDNLKTIDENLSDLGFTPAIYSPEYKLLSRDEIIHCHVLKMRVIPWTVNEVKDMLELKTWNVDGFITDYPDRAQKMRRTLNIKANRK